MTIWELPLPSLDDVIAIEMPMAARLLAVQMQNNQPCLWALVNPNNPVVRRHFYCAGTGHPIDVADSAYYVGTFQMAGGQLVFHLFDLGEEGHP